MKERIKILIANLLAHIGQTIAMVLLNSYTGATMAFIITIILILTLSKFTYNGYLSLLSVAVTLVLTYGLWQKM